MVVKSVESMVRSNPRADASRALMFIAFVAVFSLLTVGLSHPAAAQDEKDEKSEKKAESNDDSDDGDGGSDEPAGPSYIGVGLGVYLENSRVDGETTELVDTTDNSFDYSADNFLQGSIWTLKTATKNVRAGAGLHYYGGYETLPEPEEDQEPEDVEASELGQKLTVFARGEWLVPFADDKDLVLGAEAGLVALFPDGEFRQRIENMKDDGITVFGGPRPGVSLSPIVGARWQLDERLAIRADFAVRWQRIILFNVSDEVEGNNYERDWTAKILRYNLGVGMEVTL
jgi:hypothetical protein